METPESHDPTPPRTSADNATRTRIVHAAEEILAEHGLEGLSLRTVTTRANVNLASVHYYFGSKDGLVTALVREHFTPINIARLKSLDAAIARADGRPPALEDLVDAFVEPLLVAHVAPDDPRASIVRRAVGQMLALPPDFSDNLFRETFGTIASRFHQALSRALPQLSAADVYWRMHFAVGTLSHLLTHGHLLPDLSDGHCSLADLGNARARVRDFICAGLRVPATSK
ncbi:MAG: TetR family transcriptional regulator [Opitutaceae bacterium]|nr:TetR family transcriptional regulator [Opitutaceae bacterium]